MHFAQCISFKKKEALDHNQDDDHNQGTFFSIFEKCSSHPILTAAPPVGIT